MLKRLRKKPFPYRSPAWSAEYARIKAVLGPIDGTASTIRRMITALNTSHIAYPMHMERCEAYSRRTGKPCQAMAMSNGRCRMHGGASKPWTAERRAAWEANKIKRLAEQGMTKDGGNDDSPHPPPAASASEF